MAAAHDDLPKDIAALKTALLSERARASQVVAELAIAKARASDDQALIAHQQLQIAKLTRELYGQRSERSARLLDQMELAFEESESAATEDEVAAEIAAAKTTNVVAFTRKRPSRQPFPEHLPRERVIVPGPTACLCCGGDRLRKLGEDVTETLEVIPRQWKVIQYVREKFTCRDCEKISQVPAPFHVIARGWAGPSLLAMILFEKYGQHQPLNRQAERYAREGVPLSGPSPPAAMFYYSRDRKGEHPQVHLSGYAGLFQADAFDGYRKLYLPDRTPGPILEAGCWVHARRPFFAMADIEENARRSAAGKKAIALSPMAIEVVRRIDALFDIERPINGKSAEERRAVRQELSKPLVEELQVYMREQRAKLSRGNDLAKAIDYILKRWTAFTLFLDDGRVCLSNNAAERALRGIALGRLSWMFCGSDRGGQRAAALYSLIVTAKMNDIDAQAWLADSLARIAGHPAHRLDELLPWNWTPTAFAMAAAAA